MPDDRPDFEKIKEDRRHAQRAADDALRAVQESGQVRDGIRRTLVQSEQDAEQYRRVFRGARIIH